MLLCRGLLTRGARRHASSLTFANGCDPAKMSGANPLTLSNYVDGAFSTTSNMYPVVDPLNGWPACLRAVSFFIPLAGEAFIQMPRTSVAELDPFVASLKRVPKSGLHNAYKNPERCVQWGEVSARAAEALGKPEVAHHFALCIQRVMPKSYVEAMK